MYFCFIFIFSMMEGKVLYFVLWIGRCCLWLRISEGVFLFFFFFVFGDDVFCVDGEVVVGVDGYIEKFRVGL